MSPPKNRFSESSFSESGLSECKRSFNNEGVEAEDGDVHYIYANDYPQLVDRYYSPCPRMRRGTPAILLDWGPAVLRQVSAVKDVL